jgi:hypothetical protein
VLGTRTLLCSTILALVAFLMPSTVSAATHYVTPGGAGSANGSDWNNAFAGIPASLTRGDTYVLAGGTYGSHTFSTPVSGTTPIYIRKAQAGTFNGVAYNDDSIPGWISTYQTTQAVITSSAGSQWNVTTDYWNFDGVQPGVKWATTGYGIKIIPGNNSQQNHLVEVGQWPSAGYGNSVSFKNIQFINAGQSDDYEQFNLVFSGGSNDYVGYCHFSLGQNLVRLNGAQNVIVEYNYIANISYFSDHHGESVGMDLEAYSSGQAPSNTTIRYNWFNDSGTTNTTGQIIDLTNTGNTNNGVYIYGNVFLNLTGHNGIGSGNSGSPGSLTNWKLYNNTFYNSIVDVSQLSTGSELRNNMFYGSDAEVFAGSAPATRTNNYWNSSTDGLGSGTNDVISSESLASLFVSAPTDFHLTSGSQAIGAGFTLSSPYNMDPDGNTRGSGGGWDFGVYQYASGSSSTPAAPTGLAAVVR